MQQKFQFIWFHFSKTANSSFYYYCVVWMMVSLLDLVSSLLNYWNSERNNMSRCMEDLSNFSLYSLYETLVYVVFLRFFFSKRRILEFQIASEQQAPNLAIKKAGDWSVVSASKGSRAEQKKAKRHRSKRPSMSTSTTTNTQSSKSFQPNTLNDISVEMNPELRNDNDDYMLRPISHISTFSNEPAAPSTQQ